MLFCKTVLLFVVTALAEILGCYLPYLWLCRGASAALLVPAALSLGSFAWLLTLHPSLGAGRAYAAYGGVYVAVAVIWMWRVEGVIPDRWDLLGTALAVVGMSVIVLAPHSR
ncbi:MAG: YnfA family protein [Planctomycetes bacterium]|jgi:small multidrug resistance family-3 protein|nr:YnfA family protein [Candidatus Eisenbacteria bacterium]MBK9386484.1 YnfA family protein [Planctomycetota bacterium]